MHRLLRPARLRALLAGLALLRVALVGVLVVIIGFEAMVEFLRSAMFEAMVVTVPLLVLAGIVEVSIRFDTTRR